MSGRDYGPASTPRMILSEFVRSVRPGWRCSVSSSFFRLLLLFTFCSVDDCFCIDELCNIK